MKKLSKTKLSETEEIIYKYMKSYYKEKGHCPNLYEICDFIEKSYGVTKYNIIKLKDKGLVKSVIRKKSVGVWEYVLLTNNS